MDHELKVFQALSIATSDARDETLKSVVILVLFDNDKLNSDELKDIISKDFSFEPHENELNVILKKLIDDGNVNKSDNYLSLANSEVSRITELNAITKSRDNQRFSNFSNFIIKELELEISIPHQKILWKEFLTYLYNCFYKYGYEALSTLNPRVISAGGENGYSGILSKSKVNLSATNPALVEPFLEVVSRFADFASNDDIEFLHDLAQKTSSFSSLGIDPELAEVGIEFDLIDWVLYLDTNVLYSLLSLRYHPENQACMALIQLLQDNKDYFKVKLRYSSITLKELKTIKENFDPVDNSLTSSAIKAMLKSGRLNAFMLQFYENLLNNRESTLHPDKVVDLSSLTLGSKGIDIGQNDARIEKIGEDIIDSQITKYYEFLDNRNRAKEEFCNKRGIPFFPITKGEKQVRHDVSLREILLDSRSLEKGETPTLNSLKYFGLTLDENLMRFDKKMTKDNLKENSFPVFFRPSYLLNRLTKILPIKTVNYKQAFIKAITSKVYFKNTRHSNDVIQIVSYLKSQGIDNTNLIYNIISQDLILDNYSNHKADENFDKGDFISSEINAQMNKVEVDLSAFKEQVKVITVDSEKSSKEKDLAINKSKEYKELLEHFKQASKTLTKRVKTLENSTVASSKQTTIDFSRDEEILDLKLKLVTQSNKNKQDKILIFKQSKLSKWRKAVWYNLFWVFPCLLLSGLITFSSNHFPLNYIFENPSQFSQTISGILVFLIPSIFIYLISIRYWNPSTIKAYLDNITPPDN